jgi:hypothetical protein
LSTPKSTTNKKLNRTNSKDREKSLNKKESDRNNLSLKYTVKTIKEEESRFKEDKILSTQEEYKFTEEIEEIRKAQTVKKRLYNTEGKKILKANTIKSEKIVRQIPSFKERPRSEYKKEEINKNTIKHIERPKSSFKKYDTDNKLNEASLSTEASIFRGRIEDYAIGKEIGKGAYAIVKQANHKPTNRKMAVKIYEKSKLLDPQRKSSVKREIQILKKLDHVNIVKLNEVIDTAKQVRIYIIFRYCL